MTILAISVQGKEYLYNPKTAHAVSKRSAETIKIILNTMSWRLKENETWFIHEVDEYSAASDYAETQKFTIRKGLVTERRRARW